MVSKSLRIKTPKKDLHVVINRSPWEEYGELCTSIPINSNPIFPTRLLIKTSEGGKNIDQVYLTESRKSIVTSDKDKMMMFYTNAVNLWNRTTTEIAARTGMCFPGEAKTTTDIVNQLHVLLSDINKRFNDAYDEAISTNGRRDPSFPYKSYEELLAGSYYFPKSPKGLNFNLLPSIYANPRLYSSPDMFSPPSERKPHVLRFELTQGCDYNACTFCTGYKGIPFKEKTYTEFMQHYEDVMDELGEYKNRINRIFIGGGNALGAQQQTLSRIVNHLHHSFSPRRIAIYGRADSISDKGKSHQLMQLRDDGLDLIYWGVESGSQETLDYAKKGVTVDQMLSAGYLSREARIDLSVMVMLGLGGIKHFQPHVDGTVALLNAIDTRYITFMGINPSPASVYSRRMNRETEDGQNRPLTDREVIEQFRQILQGMNPNGQKVGIYNREVDQVGHNPVNFNLNFDYNGKSNALLTCDRYLKR